MEIEILTAKEWRKKNVEKEEKISELELVKEELIRRKLTLEKKNDSNSQGIYIEI